MCETIERLAGGGSTDSRELSLALRNGAPSLTRLLEGQAYVWDGLLAWTMGGPRENVAFAPEEAKAASEAAAPTNLHAAAPATS